jgi:hypothetical protein
MTRITGGPIFFGRPQKDSSSGRDGGLKDRRPDAGLIDGGSGIGAVKRRSAGSIAYLGSTFTRCASMRPAVCSRSVLVRRRAA